MTPCRRKTLSETLGKITQPFISLSAKTPRREGGLSGSIRAVSHFDPPQTLDKGSGARGAGGRLLPLRGEGFPSRGQEAKPGSSESSTKEYSLLGATGIGKKFLANSMTTPASEKKRECNPTRWRGAA